MGGMNIDIRQYVWPGVDCQVCGLSEGWSGAAAGLGISEMDEILSKSKQKDTTTLL